MGDSFTIKLQSESKVVNHPEPPPFVSLSKVNKSKFLFCGFLEHDCIVISLFAGTGTPTSLSTSALWISNQPMTRFSGISSGACCNAWGCMATCWVLSSPCMMGLCCLCELEVSVAQARAHPSASDRAARSVLLFSASSLIASSLIAPFADHCSSCWSASQASQAHRFGLS